MFLSYFQAILLASFELIVLISSVRKVEYFLSAYLFFRPILQSVANLGYKIYFVPLSGISTVILVVLGILISSINIKRYIHTLNGVLLLLVVFFSIPSFIITPDLSDSFNGVTKLLGAVICYFLAYGVSSNLVRLQSVLRWLFLSQIFPVGYAAYQKITNSAFKFRSGTYGSADRISSTIGSSNDYGIFLAITLIAAIVLLLITKNIKFKIIIYLTILMNLASLLFSLNRGTWIALSFSMVISSLIYIKRVKIKRIIVVGTLIIGIAVPISIPIVIDRFSELDKKDQYGQSQNTFASRIEFFKFLLPEGIKKGLTGHGFNSTHTYTGNAPHNDYLRILFEMGIIPFFLYCLFLSRIFFYSSKRTSRQGKYWYINYGMLMLIIYQVIISMVQQPSYSLSNFPQFLTFVGLWEGSLRSSFDGGVIEKKIFGPRLKYGS
jgi:O-antigen ligase